MSENHDNSHESGQINSNQDSSTKDKPDSLIDESHKNENILYTSWQRWLDQRMNHGAPSSNSCFNQSNASDEYKRNQDKHNLSDNKSEQYFRVETDRELEEKFGGFDLQAHNVYSDIRDGERYRQVYHPVQRKKYNPQDYIKNRKVNPQDERRDSLLGDRNFDEIQQSKQDQYERNLKQNQSERIEKEANLCQRQKPLKGYDKQRSIFDEFDESLPLRQHHQQPQHKYHSQVYNHQKSSEYENKKFQYNFDSNILNEIQPTKYDQNTNKKFQGSKQAYNPFYAKIRKENPSSRHKPDRQLIQSQHQHSHSQISSSYVCRCGVQNNDYPIIPQEEDYRSFQQQGYAISPYQYQQQLPSYYSDIPNRNVGNKYFRDSEDKQGRQKTRNQDRERNRNTKVSDGQSQDFSFNDWL